MVMPTPLWYPFLGLQVLVTLFCTVVDNQTIPLQNNIHNVLRQCHFCTAHDSLCVSSDITDTESFQNPSHLFIFMSRRHFFNLQSLHPSLKNHSTYCFRDVIALPWYLEFLLCVLCFVCYLTRGLLFLWRLYQRIPLITKSNFWTSSI